eukprot:TRINITY_DN746_c0_g1_i10.p1 TRINITY_DN746_c0_g1~~TRINITY_DN746_c0_g1_i10.p1  ORF type:complete len:456 (-),score=94.15 TRINITY_DN746_c0_g1_i10:22-1389(-)
MWSSIKSALSINDSEESSEQQDQSETPDTTEPVSESSTQMTTAPHEISVQKVLMSILTTNVIGKDVFTGGISLPTELYEPLTILQRMCEMIEWGAVLEEAITCTDSLDRMAYVIGFAVSGYCNTDKRMHTAFNPLLGETYEYECARSGARYFAEQVSHHPPVSACHAQNDHWVFWQNSFPQTKFKGNSIDIDTHGRSHLYFNESKDHFFYTNPVTRVHNIIFGGSTWIEHYGELKMSNLKTGDKAVINFKPSGFFSSKPAYIVTGDIFDCTGKKVIHINGRWDSHIEATWLRDTKDSQQGQKKTVWQNFSENCVGGLYCFTQFAETLNEVHGSTDYYLPTDSRLRADRQLLDELNYDDANKLKKIIEERQREDRKIRAEKGEDWEPLWFHKIQEEDGGSIWVYCGDYWERKDQKMSDDYVEDENGDILYPPQVKELACDFKSYDEILDVILNEPN